MGSIAVFFGFLFRATYYEVWYFTASIGSEYRFATSNIDHYFLNWASLLYCKKIASYA